MNFAAWIVPMGWDAELCGRLCLVLAHSLWQFSLLGVLATLIARTWKNAPPERIYAIYTAALLLGLLALPTTLMLTRLPGESVTFRKATTVPRQQISLAPKAPSERQIPVQQASPSVVASAPPTLPTAAPRPPHTTATSLLAWAPWLVGCYVVGVTAMLVRLIRSLWQNYRLSAQATSIASGPLVETLQRLARTWSLRAVPALAFTQRVIVPQVVGLWRPTILLPAAALAGLRPDELEMILAHELAHVRRYDLWMNLVQRLAEAVLFFNPAVWYLNRRVSLYREYCCDEATCRLARQTAGDTRLRYAEALLRAVELSKGAAQGQKLAALAASGNRPSELRRRVARLFGEPLREPVRISRTGLVSVITGVALVLVAPLAWHSAAEENQDRGVKATIEGRIVLENGNPATKHGWMYYDSRFDGGNSAFGAIGKYTDQFSCEVPSGKTWLRYFPEEFAPVEVGPFELKPGGSRDGVKIILKQGITKRLQIAGPDDQPIAAATVVASPAFRGSSNGPVHERTTNDHGELVIEHMAEARYNFRVQAPGYENLETEVPIEAGGEPLILTMPPAKPTHGIIRHADGSLAAGANIFMVCEAWEGGALNHGTGFGKLVATADDEGHFLLDQLSQDRRYLFVIEAKDKTRMLVPDLTAGQENREIVLPERRDLLVRFHGEVPTRKNGKSILTVRQWVALRAEGVTGYSGPIGEDVPIEVTETNGMRTMLYRGLVVDPRPESQPQYFEAWVAELPEHVDLPRIQMADGGQTIIEVGTPSEAAAADEAKPTVEVLGIGTFDQQPQQWWDAEGKLLKDVPFHVQGASVTGEARQLVFRIANLPKDADVTWELTGCGGNANGQVVLKGDRGPDGYFSHVFAIRKDSPMVNLRVGVATGKWKNISSASASGSRSEKWLNGKEVTFTGTFTKEDQFSKSNRSSVVVVSHNFQDTNVRVLAVDKSGESHRPSGSSAQGIGSSVILVQYSFRDLLPDQIDHFEFQTRLYEWTEINDLPVEPGERVTVKPQPKEEGDHEESRGLASEKIAALEELLASYEAMYERTETLHRDGLAGGEPTKKWLALYHLSMTRAELAETRGETAQALQHYDEAIEAADEIIHSAQALHEAGRGTGESVIEGGTLRAKAKLAKIEAQERPQ